MASGPAHYETAENLIEEARAHYDAGNRIEADWLLRQAEVHTGLAQAAATALAGLNRTESDAWNGVAGSPPDPSLGVPVGAL